MRKFVPGTHFLAVVALVAAGLARGQTDSMSGMLAPPPAQPMSVKALPVPAVLPVLPVLPAQAVSNPTPETVVYGSTDSLDEKRKLTIGDHISYRVIEDKNPAVSLVVTDSGDIDAPLLGRVAAAGKTCRQLAYEMKPVLEKTYFYKATVIVALDMATQKSPGRIYVSGLVVAPGAQDMPPDEIYTLSRAIMRAGGVAQFGNGHRVKIVRKNAAGATQNVDVDVDEIINKGRIDKDPVLQPDDMIVVPRKLINF